MTADTTMTDVDTSTTAVAYLCRDIELNGATGLEKMCVAKMRALAAERDELERLVEVSKFEIGPTLLKDVQCDIERLQSDSANNPSNWRAGEVLRKLLAWHSKVQQTLEAYQRKGE